jgi:hypothetical protein
MKRHYHYHVTFRSGRQRLIDSVPYVTRVGALEAIKYSFCPDEKPKVKRFDASRVCGATNHYGSMPCPTPGVHINA